MFPCTSTPSDAHVEVAFSRQEAVEHALGHAGYPELQQIDVWDIGGCIELTGTVRTYYMKQLAQTAALAVPGVTEVKNEVLVT